MNDDGPLVRIAELEIIAGQLERYKALLAEEMAISVRVEPGVLSLQAVSIAGRPTSIRIFEIYADQAAYEAHLQAPHFLRYKQSTSGMVQSLQLLETLPILLAAKSTPEGVLR